MNRRLSIDLSPELVDAIAARVADLLVDRQPAGPAEPDGFLDIAGAADFLACPTSRLYALVSAKRIPYHKDGSRLLFDRAELRDYVRRGGRGDREYRASPRGELARARAQAVRVAVRLLSTPHAHGGGGGTVAGRGPVAGVTARTAGPRQGPGCPLSGQERPS